MLARVKYLDRLTAKKAKRPEKNLRPRPRNIPIRSSAGRPSTTAVSTGKTNYDLLREL
jgi:hypothetical protein